MQNSGENNTIYTVTTKMSSQNEAYMYIAYIVLGISSCSANGTLIWIILRNRNFLTVSNVIIVSLAISDFMLGAIVSPMEMLHHLMPDFEIVGYGCLAHQVVMIFVPLVSIVHLLLVAIERFLKIVYPLHHHGIVTKKRTAVIIAIAWILPLLLCLLPFAGIHQNMIRPNGTDTICSTLDMLPCSYLHCILGMIAVICVIMGVLYTKIMKIAFRHAKQIRETCFPREKSKHGKASEIRALTVLLVTVAYFIFSWAPFGASVVQECIEGSPVYYYTPVVFLAYFNSTINPLIYGIGNRDLRNSLLDRCCRRKSNKVGPTRTGITTLTQNDVATASL